MTTTVLHLIQHLSAGGASRALTALARESARCGAYEHRVVSLLPVDGETARRTREAGLDLIETPDTPALHQLLRDTDIVQVHWWNNPELNVLLRTQLPPMRLVLWYHVAGHAAPQVITPDLARFADLNIATNPWTFEELPVYRDFNPLDREQRLALIIDPADLSRVEQVTRRPHEGFNVGYIGTVDFVKMHPRYVPMSAAVRIPEARFIVCGHGCEDELQNQARQLGAADRFEFRGYVEDIPSVIETLDVYGYPLCADTYASGELNLQEVMRAGVPPVVFPHGGIRGLIVHDQTGLVVHSEGEYREAIEHLYHFPEDRIRLGRAAANHAREHFGAANAAHRVHPLYERLMARPKTARTWGCRPGDSLLAQSVSLLDVANPSGLTDGSRIFVESLGEAAQPFLQSLMGGDSLAALASDRAISRSSRLVRSAGCGGIGHYRHQFGDDPWLRYWNGLICLDEGRLDEARAEFDEAFHGGVPPGRAAWKYYQAISRLAEPNTPARTPQLPSVMTQSLSAWLADADLSATPDPGDDPEIAELRIALQNLSRPPGTSVPQEDLPAPLAPPPPPSRRPGKSPRDLAAQFTAVAEKHLKAGNPAAARECLERALELAPNAIPLLSALGNVLQQTADHSGACNVFARLIQAEPKNPDHHAYLAESQLRLGQVEEFQKSIAAALEIDPKNIPAQRLVAEVTFMAGHYGNAITACESILDQASDDVPALLLFGAAHAKSNHLQIAADTFSRILLLEPSNALAAENLSVCQRQLDAAQLTAPARPTRPSPPRPANGSSNASPGPRSSGAHNGNGHRNGRAHEENLNPPPLAPASTTPASHRARSYAADWDTYVEDFRNLAREEPTNHGRTDLVFPGDEWGKPSDWRAFSHRFLRPYLPSNGGGIAVEIGQGSGKYTLEVLDLTRQIVCFDVSQAFIEVARRRLSEQVDSGHVALEQLKLENCNELTDVLAARGLIGHVDLVFSIDAMVHVELHTLFAYLVAASHALKPGGHVVMTVASCTNPGGYQRLIEEAAWYYGGQRPGHQFYFLSPDIVRHLCQQLGFDIVQLEEGRDISFAARKIRQTTVRLQPCSN